MGRAVDRRNALSFGRLAAQRPAWAKTWTQWLGGRRTIDFPVPTPIAASGVAEARASWGWTLIRAHDGSVAGMGNNLAGQLGLGSSSRVSEYVLQRVAVDPSVKATRIAAGQQHGAMVDDQGRVWTWGMGEAGQLGRPDGVEEPSTPGMVRQLPAPAIDVVCGFNTTAALLDDGRVFVWGKMQSLDLASGGTRFADATAPRLVNLSTRAKQIHAGLFHTFVVDERGDVFQWGLRVEAAGAGTPLERTVVDPVPVRLGPHLRSSAAPTTKPPLTFAAGFSHGWVIDPQSGKAFAWDWDLVASPFAPTASLRVVAVSEGWRHSAVVVDS